MRELISVVIPIYKVEEQLNRCLTSVLNQTYSNLEVILVDDGSPDKCPEICDNYAKKDKRVKVIHKTNGGLSDARNAGINIATGKYITFIDSDDCIHAKFIETLYQIMIEYKSEVSICQYHKFQNNSELAHIQTLEQKTYESLGIELLKNIKEEEYITFNVAWGKLYKMDLFTDIRYPKGKLHEDEFTTYKLLYKAKKVAITNQKLYYYWMSNNSIMGKKYNIKRLDILEALKERMKFYLNEKQMELYDKTRLIYINHLIYAYFNVKKYIEDSKKIQNEIRENMKREIPYIVKNKKVSIRYKINLGIACYLPTIYQLRNKNNY